MRFCRECGQVYEDDGNVCVPCNARTEDMGEFDGRQGQLFAATDRENMRGVYRYLQRKYREACEGVAKAETSLNKKAIEYEAAKEALIKQWKAEQSRGHHPAATDEGTASAEEDAPDATYLLPAGDSFQDDGGGLDAVNLPDAGYGPEADIIEDWASFEPGGGQVG
jgi:hypothetical protein